MTDDHRAAFILAWALGAGVLAGIIWTVKVSPACGAPLARHSDPAEPLPPLMPPRPHIPDPAQETSE